MTQQTKSTTKAASIDLRPIAVLALLPVLGLALLFSLWACLRGATAQGTHSIAPFTRFLYMRPKSAAAICAAPAARHTMT